MAIDPIEQDDEDQEDAPEVAAEPTPAPPTGVTAPSAATPMNPQLSQYLQNKQAMAAAQQKANTNQLFAGLGRAAGTLAHSAYGATAAEDTRGYDALDKSAQAPVQQEEAREALQGKDPESDTAKRLREIYKPIFAKSGLDPKSLDGLGADDIKAYAQNPLEFIDKQKTLESTKSLAVKAAQDARNDKASEREDARETKATEAQSKAYTTMRKDLESFRGNQSVQQAATAVQNSDKALALAKSDPTSQNLQLLADEMGKIAMGGVPGEHGTQALMPNNLYTKIGELKAWATGHPNASAADVSEYLKNNVEYINQVRDISAKALKGYRTNIAKGYKSRVSEDQYQEAVDDYGMGGDREPAAPAAPTFPPDVLAYSKAHGITPDQAAAIKAKRGGK